MGTEAWVNFSVALDVAPLVRLFEEAEAEREREAAWVGKQRERLEGLSRREAARIRREIRVELAAKRARGELGGTRDLLVARALREELRVLGLDQEWPAPPEGELNAPGRRWGTVASRPMGSGGYPESLSVRLPFALAETIRRAAYWTSKAPTEALQEWDERWGRAGEVVQRDAELDGRPEREAAEEAGKRPSAPRAALDARDKLRAQVVTVGDLLRAAVDRAGRPGQQTEVPAEASPQAPVTQGAPRR